LLLAEIADLQGVPFGFCDLDLRKRVCALAKTKTIVPTTGEAALKVTGFDGPAAFSFDGEPTALKAGLARMRGWIATTPAVAGRAFRAGEATLTLAEGAVLRLTFLGHTVDDGKVYFEARV
jgi:hypothetical protein